MASQLLSRSLLRSWLVLGMAILVVGAGCDPPEPYVSHSGPRLQPRTSDAPIKVLRSSAPERPYVELGEVQVSCPTQTSRDFWGSVTAEGGCSYGDAISRASQQAHDAGADGIFNITTSASSNGNLVSLIATAFRYTGAPARTPIVPPVSPPPASPPLASQATTPPSVVQPAQTPSAAPATASLLPTAPAIAPASPPAAASTLLPVEERLRRLKELRDKGLIPSEMYERRRKEILKSL